MKITSVQKAIVERDSN